jgi:hypothetical protein
MATKEQVIDKQVINRISRVYLNYLLLSPDKNDPRDTISVNQLMLSVKGMLKGDLTEQKKVENYIRMGRIIKQLENITEQTDISKHEELSEIVDNTLLDTTLAYLYLLKKYADKICFVFNEKKKEDRKKVLTYKDVRDFVFIKWNTASDNKITLPSTLFSKIPQCTSKQYIVLLLYIKHNNKIYINALLIHLLPMNKTQKISKINIYRINLNNDKNLEEELKKIDETIVETVQAKMKDDTITMKYIHTPDARNCISDNNCNIWIIKSLDYILSGKYKNGDKEDKGDKGDKEESKKGKKDTKDTKEIMIDIDKKFDIKQYEANILIEKERIFLKNYKHKDAESGETQLIMKKNTKISEKNIILYFIKEINKINPIK